MSDASIWICPGCSRKFRLPAGKTPPRQCQNCLQAAPSPPPAPVIDEASFLADIAAVAPPPAPTPAPPSDPGQAPGFVRIISADTVKEEDLRAAIRRDRTRRRLIVGGIVATASGLLIGLGVVLASYFSGPYRMPKSEIYDQVKQSLYRRNKSDLSIVISDFPEIIRDATVVDGRRLSIVHTTFTATGVNGMSITGPWSAIVSVDHANRVATIELDVIGDMINTDQATPWFLNFYGTAETDPSIKSLVKRVLQHK